jgi:2-polyprenyl-3-methyl-5-hydroxy-6-metoxy-1,4-benzoquinol methylase
MGAPSEDVRQAVNALLADPSANEWFREIYWRENDGRVQRMMTDVLARFPKRAETRILDVGCFSGYITFLFGKLGYRMSATDALAMPTESGLLDRVGATFFHANFNESNPFPQVPEAAYDVVLLGEVIEHILNHPLGLLQSLARVTRPGGLLVLTTPNPATLMNSVRLLRGQAIGWGADDFMKLPKFEPNGGIISHEGIHYHEYLKAELERMLVQAGYQVELHAYLPMGVTNKQAPLKRWLKRSAFGHWLASHRLFGSTHYMLARKPA